MAAVELAEWSHCTVTALVYLSLLLCVWEYSSRVTRFAFPLNLSLLLHANLSKSEYCFTALRSLSTHTHTHTDRQTDTASSCTPVYMAQNLNRQLVSTDAHSQTQEGKEFAFTHWVLRLTLVRPSGSHQNIQACTLYQGH